jgi:hypothetical protein
LSEFCYTTVPGKVKTLLGKVRETGVPKKVTVQWLRTLGFTSSNDSTLIGVLKQIDFVDLSGVPTVRWTNYRGGDHKKVLGEAIRHGYADLYAVYADAHRRSPADLDHVFSTHSSGGKQVINKTISTFRSLAELAEFASSGSTSDTPAAPPPTPAPRPASGEAGEDVLTRPNLHIDIQVHIPPEASLEQIEKVFESMARHLYGVQKTDK